MAQTTQILYKQAVKIRSPNVPRNMNDLLTRFLISWEFLCLGRFALFWVQDLCYYANTIFLIMLLAFPTNERFFMVCFSFAEGRLAWALIVWRCSLVFSSVDKTGSVFIHLLPGGSQRKQRRQTT
ncbi:glycerophosphocholine acyltransferase 1-like isoform X2 [Nicotiana tomentosiformis]|uniref:glycerophosphocholine acyltransferase 1-like isoform X2 n=1 Tax=Nicotiana tomentosiformis TaxID=4098 RepID=UPI00051ABE0C|nr:uncharacterized membrane protein C776.05-like isoform X2 [Nicotiana tomentosiformis]